MTTVDAVREILTELREQNQAMLMNRDETERILERIAVATEKTAARVFWLVLPVYVSLILGAVGLVVTGFVMIAPLILAR